MAITVCGNCIGFGGSYTLCSTAPGFSFDGVIKAGSGFCDTTPSPAQGSVSGYSAGGAGSSPLDTIDKFPFSSVSNATDVGDLSVARKGAGSSSSPTHGYTIGGEGPADTFTGGIATYEKFPFASDTNGSCVASIPGAQPVFVPSRYTSNVKEQGGSGFQTQTHGYAAFIEQGDSGGLTCFPFASDTDLTSLSEMNVNTKFYASLNSIENGYIAGGDNNQFVHRFSYANDNFSACIDDVGCCVHNFGAAGNSEAATGYFSGGQIGPSGGTLQIGISKFPFASETSSLCVACLTQARRHVVGVNSQTEAFILGGSPPFTERIESFPFASASPTTCVACLTRFKAIATGNQI